MTAGRVDFYTKVHKALRAELFGLSARAASTDYADATMVHALAMDLRSLLSRLSAHAAHESRFIHPLIEEKTGQNLLDAEHRSHEEEQAGLAALLEGTAVLPAKERRQAGLAFYRALNVFIARYLEHLEREEATMAVLWELCDDAELGDVLSRFGASRPLDEALRDIGWMLPSLNADEQRELIGGMSAALARRHAG